MKITRPFLPLVVALALVVAGLVSVPVCAQDGPPLDEAGFVTTLGDDTLAVEQFRRTPARVEATVVLRTPQTTITRYQLDLGEGDAFDRYEATTRRPGASDEAAPLRRVVVVPEGDSLRMTVTEEGETIVRSVGGDAEALPFIDMVHWPFDLMLERAQASGEERITQPLFTERGVLSFTVAADEGSRMTVTHPFRGTMEVETGAEGRLQTLDAGATTRKLVVRRVEEVDLEALTQRYRAMDEAGASFGPLSGRGETVAVVDGATIAVDYGQPAQRGRELFGALVPWGERWRTGANRATHFSTDRDLMMGDLRVPAGEYTLFTIPEPGGGTLIVNRQTGQGGTTYDETQDLGRIPMTRSERAEPVELFTIAIDDAGEGGTLELQWGRTAFAVPFIVAE
jgi:hypothetical protein